MIHYFIFLILNLVSRPLGRHPAIEFLVMWVFLVVTAVFLVLVAVPGVILIRILAAVTGVILLKILATVWGVILVLPILVMGRWVIPTTIRLVVRLI